MSSWSRSSCFVLARVVFYCAALAFVAAENLTYAAVAYGSSGGGTLTTSGSTSGTTSLSVPYPTGITAGDMLVLAVGNKYATGSAPVTPSGWTLAIQQSGGIDTGTGNDRGQVYSTIFTKQALGTESGNLTVAVTGANTSMARMFRYTKTPGSYWETAVTSGVDNTPGTTWSITAAANPGITAGDIVFVASALNGNQVTNWTQALTTAGVTYSAVAERNDTTSGTGNDMGLIVADFTATAGTATGVPVYSMAGATGFATTYSPTGASSFLRLRQSTTTLSTGVDPGAASIAPGAGATDVNYFWLQTSSFTESVISVTVNLSTNSGIARLAITDSADAELGFTTSPVVGLNTITINPAGTMTATTTSSKFKVRVTPSSHADMPAVPGGAYAITAPVTTWVGPNVHVGSDTNVNALTIDNLSPTSATSTSGSPGYLANTLKWTTSLSSDFALTSGSVVYRWADASTTAEVPAEGSSPTVGSTNGTATVACVVSSTGAVTFVDGSGGTVGCQTSALATGKSYTYKVFQKDGSGNFDAGVSIGTFKSYGDVDPDVSTVVASPSSVAADSFTASTITVTLMDKDSTPVPGKAVSLSADLGSSIITTQNGTSNSSGVATFTVVDGTVEGPIKYTAKDTTDGKDLNKVAQVTFTAPSLCFTDNFNRADGTLLSTGYWTRTHGATTTYDADIVSNRLRLTDAANNRATAVHLFRLFPGAGNKVTAEFDYYTYTNSAGGDGLVLTLSDSSIAPVAGAFGGSLGYAQKNATACPPSGCPGFAGGWIGIGIDEFGNFSNPTEGRVDGPGLNAKAVTIRGSGSAYAGYNWHTTAAATSVTTTPLAPHHYRVIVDHSNGVNAWVSVERDTAGGTNYTKIVSAYDAKAIPTQAAVPPYWYFSLTASTGSATNIHEIDNINICTAQPLITPTLNHLRVEHDGSALTCAAETITLKACANSACSALYTGSVTVSLPTISGATWSSSSVTFTGGQTTVTLTKTTAGTVNLSGSTVTSPTISSPAGICYNGATSGDCSLVYTSNACAFDAVEPGKSPQTPIYTKLAGTQFTLDVLALTAGAVNTAYAGTASVSIVDQSGVAAGSCGTTPLACTMVPASPITFVNGRRSVAIVCADARKDVRVAVSNSTTSACSSDNFTIRPASFSTSSTTASNAGSSGTPVVKAGALFDLSATALNTSSVQTSGYTGTPSLNNSKVLAHNGAVTVGTLSGAFSGATGGVSSGSFSYSEVGNFQLSAWGVYDDGGFASVDRSKATPECFSDAKLGTSIEPAPPNTSDGNGMFGCYFGSVATPFFGRFIPDHFVVTAAAPVAGCSVGASPYTYFGQDGFTTPFSLTAQNASNTTTQNYVGSYAKLGLTTWGLAPASSSNPGFGFATSTVLPTGSSLGPGAITSSGSWSSGTASVSARHQVSRPTNLAGETAVTVTALPVDSDGVTMTSALVVQSVATALRFGRLRLISGQGSELAPYVLKTEAQYWDGSFWRVNLDDSCTTYTVSNAKDNSTVPITSVSAATSVKNGYGTLTFAKPTSSGTATVCMDLSATANGCTASAAGDIGYLLGNWGGVSTFTVDPSASILFGGAAANSRGNWGFLYRRENY
ncbi:DUF6701 domain-containing protein [Propionivibrio dicarboxylicus]|uniref:Big-1 domain-containing protein n=1 Tax=Propionivibrio dicarboxylicus TaxID=83767 RepID=A0A1G8IJQ0_9RHOO|nr:DUF6701 domain-containing protein [Propionivibrio dicarboxylicus]SDI19135.1 hypothetical protein SAMN05660652_03013 [Propionivibrio dicarboxylicus]